MEQECIPLGDMSGEYCIDQHMSVRWLPHVCQIITTSFGHCIDYDDDGGAATDGYYDNIDQQRIEEAICSHDPGDVYAEQAPIGM